MAQKRSKGQGIDREAGQKGRGRPDERGGDLSSQNGGKRASKRGEAREKLDIGAGNTKADEAAEEALGKPTQLSDRSGRGAMNGPGNPPGQEGRGAAE